MTTRCQTEISVCARPFCNFLEVSNIKVKPNYIKNTMRGKTTLWDFLLSSSMVLGLSLEFVNQKKNDNVSNCNVKAFIYSFEPLLLSCYYRPYHHTVTVVHQCLQNKGIRFWIKQIIMSSAATTVLRKASSGIPVFCLALDVVH